MLKMKSSFAILTKKGFQHKSLLHNYLLQNNTSVQKKLFSISVVALPSLKATLRSMLPFGNVDFRLASSFGYAWRK